jgi:hypothetical protein
MSDIAVWEMVKEAIQALGGKATYAEIIEYVIDKWPSTKPRNILTEIFACTVNHHARIHYKAKEEGLADKPYDFLYQPRHGVGYVEWYEACRHGTWGNMRGPSGKLVVTCLVPVEVCPQVKRGKSLRKKAASPKTPRRDKAQSA